MAGTGLPCFLTQFDLPHVAYAPHLYPFLPNILNVYLGNPGEIEHILDGIDWTAGNMKAPVWVGEWALFNAGTINADLYMQDMTRLLDEHLASWSYWIYNKDGNVGLLDADGNERAWVLDKVSRPYPQRTAGFPVNYSFDLDTKHFEMTWNENPPATGSDAPGAWSYEWDDARQMLSVTADRTIASHTLTIEAK